MPARVVSVSASPSHSFSKPRLDAITLLAGLGVQGDAHCGASVKHRSRVAKDAAQPNLRQVHLLHAELFGELAAKGFDVHAGDIGENVTTEGIDLLGLPQGALLHIGASAVVRITGLRNPCRQLDGFQPGLMAAVLERLPEGTLRRKAGVMGVVLAGGEVRAGDEIRTELPAGPRLPLQRI
jgi:MOSC domain-containing protein YiiM